MKTEWVKRDNCERLIVFFNGWGMDMSPFSALVAEGFDLVCHYDYSSFSVEQLDYLAELAVYDEIYLVAWSYGVWVAGELYGAFPRGRVKALAINGTLRPIDDEYGIHKEIFEATMAGLSAKEQVARKIRDRFYYNMFDSKDDYSSFLAAAPGRGQAEQRDELELLSKKIFESPGKSDISFDKAVICSKDRIIPVSNQRRFWQEEGTTIQELEIAHFPFYRWKSWDDLITEVFKVG